MLAVQRQKKIWQVILVSILVIAIVCSMGIGVYFMFKDKGPNGLTREQQLFGNAIIDLQGKPVVDFYDENNLPNGVDASKVQSVSNSLVVVNNNGMYEFFDVSNNEQVEFDALSINALESVYFNLAVVIANGQKVLIDVVSNKLVCGLDCSSYQFGGNYVYVKTGFPNCIQGLPQSSEYANCCSIVVDAISGEVVSGFSASEDIINITFGSKVLVVSTLENTKIYSLSNFDIISSFENTGSVSIVKSNLESSISEQSYYMTSYHRVFEFGNNKLLVEKTYAVEGDDYHNYNYLADGSIQKYKSQYTILDIATGKTAILDSCGKALQVQDVSLGNNYVAVIHTGYEQKNELSLTDKTIGYYYVTSGAGKNLKVEEMVSYDYSKGVIVGFTGKNLILGGSQQSSIINFEGKVINEVNDKQGQKITLGSYSDAVIVSSVSGVKQVLSNDGKTLVNYDFLEVSPFFNGKALAKTSTGYYIVDSKGDVQLISNFSEEFEQYLFSQIGLYVTTNGFKYDIYDINGLIEYESVGLEIIKDITGNLYLYIDKDGQKTLLVAEPVKTNNLVISQGSLHLFARQGLKTIQESNQLEPTIEVLDSATGIATASYDFNVTNVQSLEYSDYDSLEDTQKALIPVFDKQETSGGNIDHYYVTTIGEGVSSVTVDYLFDGAYFVYSDNFVIVLIKLTASGYDDYYLTTIAFKQTYLSALEINVKDSGTNDIVDINLNYSNNVAPALMLTDSNNFKFSSEQESGSRTVNYLSAGYEGGYVYALENSSSIDYSIILRNTFFAQGLESEELDLSNETIVYTHSSEKYTIRKDSNEIVISVPDGYLITGLSYSFYQESTSINLTSLEETEAQTIDTICNSYSISLTGVDSSFFKLLSITIIESYSIINIDNDSDLVENDTIYYFYGYGEDITTVNNPARLGFNNFERVEGISLPTKTGYNFKGYKYNTTDDIVVSESGSIEPDFDQLKPTGNMSSVLTNTINAVWEGKTYNIYYYVDISSSSIIDEATKTITFGSPIGTMFNIVNDFGGDKAKKGFDFVAWVNKQTGSIVTEETIHNVDSSLYVYATWQECEYTNTFSWVSGKNYGSIKHNDSEIMSSGQDNYEHQGVKYENSKKHRYEIVANDSLLKYISVNGLYVEFDYSYGQLYNSAPYYDLEVSDSNIDGGSPTINKSWYYQSNYYAVYTINLLEEFYAINVTYHLATNKFIYTLSVVNLEDLSISVGLEQVQSATSYEVYNEDLEQLDETLVTTSSTGADSITPSQNKTITFTPNSTSYISGVVVSYNGLSLNAFSSVVNVDGTQTVSLVNSNYFTKEGDAINLKSSSVSIVYDSTSRAITISLSGVYHDIDIRVNTNTFMTMSFSVPTDMNIETGLTITINSGDEGVVRSELDDIIALYEGDIVRTTGLNQINYVINGLSSVIQSLKIETYVGDDAVYYLSSSNGVLNESKTQLVLDRTTGVNQISITGYSATLTVDNKVYEGVSFTQDQSGVERGLISKVTLTIADSNYTYEGGAPSYTLNGVTFIVDVLEVEGYKVDSLNAITGVRRIDEPISGGTRYIFTVTDFDISSFTLSIKYRANEYDVTYYANNGDSEEQTQTSHHIYNVSKGLNTNTFTKTNYHFVGWSTERLTGANLTENDATYSAGQQVKNLTAIENGTVSLYAVWEADLFTFNFNNNKGDISTDITPGTIVAVQSKFDHVIPALPTLSCIGYNFIGWSLTQDGTNKIGANTILNQDALNIANPVAEKQVVLYAVWAVKTYNIVINYNDVDQGNGSTASTTLSQTYQVVFDDAFPIIPAVERFGYNFVGYKDMKLTSDQDKTNSTSKLVNDSTILNKQFLQNATIDHSSNEVTIYATWIAKVYTANFNLNKDALEIYDDEFKFKFNGAETEISNFTLGFEFDKGIPALPTVDNGGYSFMGWFISSDYDVSSETGANSIVVGAIIDQSFINLLSLADEKFTLYAHYKINKFTMRVTSIANANYNISSMNDYLQYTNVDTFANAQHAATYASDVVFDLLPNAGYYFNNIKVIYKTSTGASETKEIVIDWSSGTKTISFTGSTQDNYVQVQGQVAFGLEGVYIKVCSYNDADGIDANRVVIAVKNIKNVISVQASTQMQTYNISYFAKLGLDGQDNLGNQTVNYGHTITTLDVPKVYEAGYAINHWEYGIPSSLTGNVLFGTDKVYQDFNITGVYDEVLEQKINFYYWDIETNEYKLRTQTSDQYILGARNDYGESWQVGANYDDYIVDGKVVKMPVVSNEIYPVGTVLVGYIIADGNLTSGDYYSWTDSNASSYVVFDKETIIDKVFDVYAVYQQQSLSINDLGNNRFNVSNNVYEVEESGWVSKISADNIYLVLLTQAEYNRYSSYVSAGNNNEVALGYAVNHNLEGRLISANNSIIDVNSNIPDSNTYYLFAIAIKESSDGIYIYYVAPNLGVEIEKL